MYPLPSHTECTESAVDKPGKKQNRDVGVRGGREGGGEGEQWGEVETCLFSDLACYTYAGE